VSLGRQQAPSRDREVRTQHTLSGRKLANLSR